MKKSICYCSNWERATHKSNEEQEELPSALCNSTVSPGSKCNSWNWQTLKWSNLREFCSQQELKEGNGYFEASAGSKIEKLTNHQICNESLADPFSSPVKPDTAWGALVTPRNAVRALKIEAFNQKTFLSVAHWCLCSEYPCIQVKVSSCPVCQVVSQVGVADCGRWLRRLNLIDNFNIRKFHLRPKLLEGTHIADWGVLEAPVLLLL